MSDEERLEQICRSHGNDPGRLIDILWATQDALGWISPSTMMCLANHLGITRVEVEGVVTFYAFFHTVPQGRFVIYLCDDIIDRHAGWSEICAAFQEATGTQLGHTSADGLFSLHATPCIGLSDQAPAALVNHQPMTQLTPAKVRRLVSRLKRIPPLEPMPNPVVLLANKNGRSPYGDGRNAHVRISAMVNNHIRHTGPVFFNDAAGETGLRQALQQTPEEVLACIDHSGLRGRGGAGYSAARKWQAAARIEATQRYVICNADEGEPGTFKDRVLLTEKAHLLIEGMTIAAYAIGSSQGILYLRAEYRYLQPYLEQVLAERRARGWLGDDIVSRVLPDLDADPGGRVFSFDVRIQLGAGAYICGEESALISSCEGRRGEPKNKPPYPAEAGYWGCPTVVNNVETLCAVARILAEGSDWFRALGTGASTGTKLLSVSGDCKKPGTYELPMGTTVNDVLTLAGAVDAQAVQVGGASGVLIDRSQFHRRLCFEDLPTAGAIMVFSGQRNVLEIVHYFMQFFIDESCGYCTPCRVGNVFLQKGLEKIMQGLGESHDLDYLANLGQTIIQTSRCGFGHTSPQPVLSSMANFPLIYAALLHEHPGGNQAGFDIQRALEPSRQIAKRRSIVFDPDFEQSKPKGGSHE